MTDDPATACTRRQAFGLILGAGAAAALAACTRSSENTGDSSSDEPIDVRDHGAVGDGVTDDTQAIQRALDAVTSGGILRFPKGMTFLHSDVLTVRNPGVTITGPGEVRATNEERSAFKVDAADVTIQDLTLGITSTTQRWSTPDQHKLFIGQVAGVKVADLRITGSAAAGLFALGSSSFHFDRVQVLDSRADGIHMTYGAHDGTVNHPEIVRSGDDGVAVVSYLQDEADCHDIEVIAPVVRDTTWGRGLSVVGGHDITYSDITVERSSAAAVYLACEGDPSNTSDTRNVWVAGGSVTGANTNPAIDHGAVLVYSGRGGGAVDNVEIAGLTIADTRPGASRQIGVVANDGSDEVSAVVFKDLRLGTGPTPYQGNAPVSAVSLDSVTADGKPVQRATVS